MGWPWAQAVADGIATLAWSVLLTFTLLYLVKAIQHRQAWRGELFHPMGSALTALVPLSFLQATVYFGQPGHLGWLLVTLAALTAHAVISFRLVVKLATGEHQNLAITPALYVPPVAGGLVGAMAMVTLGYSGWAELLLGVALSSWMLLELRVLNTLFEGPLPMPQRATIGLEMAPPTVATLAVSVIWPQLPGEYLLVGIGMCAGPIVAVIARYKWWRQVPFNPGFWSFAFPLSALASDVIVVVLRGGWPQWVAATALALATLAVGFLFVRTLGLLARGQLIPKG